MASSKLRIGVVGAGRRGRAHLATIRELPDLFELVGVCDSSGDMAEASALKAAVNAYTDVRELIAHENVEAIVIATPPETHHIVARAAAERGVHLLIESPLGTTRAMMDATAEIVAKTGVVAEIGENMWRRPTERLNRMAIDAGLIGKVMRVNSFYEDAGHDSCYHTMSRFRYYAGAEVEEVHASVRRYDLDPEVTTPVGPVPEGPYRTEVLHEETWTHALVYFTNGVVGSCTYITKWNRPLRWAHPHFVSVEGNAGYIATSPGDMNVLRRVEGGVPRTYERKVEVGGEPEHEIPTRYSYDTEPPVSYENPFADRPLTDAGAEGPADGIARAHELRCLHDSVTEGKPPQYTIEQARRDQELSIAIAESGRTGRAVRQLADDETPWERDQREAFRRLTGYDPLADAPFVSGRGRSGARNT